MKEQPLVSVVVLAYNSANTITETLDSIYSQNYDKIELVIADDASKDNTVRVAKEWIEKNGDRFVNCIINRQAENGGVPKNLNSGISAAHGKYLKIIAADDLLTPDCISVNVAACEENGYRHLLTWLRKFSVDEAGNKTFWDEEPNTALFDASAEEQFNALLCFNFVYGCIFFVEKAYIEELGMYNEDYRYMEDYPMWVKMTSKGDKLNFLNDVTVLYRVSEASLSHYVGQRVVNEGFSLCHKKFVKEQLFPHLRKQHKFIPLLKHRRIMMYHWLLIKLGNNRKHLSVRIVDFFYKRKYLKRNREINGL